MFWAAECETGGGGGKAGAGSCPLHLQWVGEPWMTPSATAGRRARPVHKSRGVCGSASYTPAVANSLTQENMALTAPNCSDPWAVQGLGWLSSGAGCTGRRPSPEEDVLTH